METIHITWMRNEDGILVSDDEGVSSGRTIVNRHADAHARAGESGSRHAVKIQERCIKTGSRT